MQLTRNQATMVGCVAPLLWGLSVSIVRLISVSVGIKAGLALNYLLAFVLVFLLFRLPRFSRMPLKYCVFGLGSAITCSVTFAFALALADNGTQTMEVGMLNYLWPALTILFAVVFNGQRARWWIWVGAAAAVYGIFMILSGSAAVDFSAMFRRMTENPAAYFLGFLAAVSWAAYSNFTTAWANGENPTTVIFGLDAVLFTTLWLISDQPADFSLPGVLWVPACALVMGSAYGLWTYGVQKGSIAVMAIASYFTPVLSCVFASFLIGAQLTPAFWSGVFVVVLGSFLCWLAISVPDKKEK